MLLSIGTLIVVAYLILSINVYLESYAFGRFSIGYGWIGPTEVRLILIALNTVVALGAGLDFAAADLELTVFDLIGLAIAGTMIALLLGRAARNLRELARKEPSAGDRLRAGVAVHARSASRPPCISESPGLGCACGPGERKPTRKPSARPSLRKLAKLCSREGYVRGRRREFHWAAFSCPDRGPRPAPDPLATSDRPSTLAGAANDLPPARVGLPPRVARPGRTGEAGAVA